MDLLVSRFNNMLWTVFCLQVQESCIKSNGCSSFSNGSVLPDLFLFSSETFSLSALQDQDLGHFGDPHCTGLAQMDVILQPGKTPDGCCMGST